MNKPLLLRYAVRESMGLVILGVALFWSAGRLDWTPGWAVLAVMAAWTLGMTIAMLRYNPSLIAERLGPRTGAKSWDTAIVSLLGLSQLVRYIVAGLGQRYDWNPGFNDSVQVAALVVCILGNGLVVWAAASNAYFSQIVRIQGERGHTVARSGPYRFVRHPAYFGAILFELAVSFVLSSWLAVLPSALNVALLTLRTALEDRTLQNELSGYADYAQDVRYRLLPGVW